MASIYDIPIYDSSKTDYVKNDIVRGDGSAVGTTEGRFYYNLGRGNSAAPEATGGAAYWGGIIETKKTTHSSASSETSPHFIWKPSYNLQATHAPRVRSVKFGDGYEQRFKDGINNNLIKLSLTFEGRDLKETKAILHFLDVRAGAEYFFFRPPTPYDALRKFVCKDFSSTVVYKDNFNISATFEQVP